MLSQRRQSVRVIETGEMIPMKTPDRLVLDAAFQSGAPLSFHNSYALAGFCGLFDCGKSLVKSDRIVKTRRSAGSVTQIMRHQPVNAGNVARRYSVFEAKVKSRWNLEFAETFLVSPPAFHSQR